jgi:hypothetical protein
MLAKQVKMAHLKAVFRTACHVHQPRAFARVVPELQQDAFAHAFLILLCFVLSLSWQIIQLE